MTKEQEKSSAQKALKQCWAGLKFTATLAVLFFVPTYIIFFSPYIKGFLEEAGQETPNMEHHFSLLMAAAYTFAIANIMILAWHFPIKHLKTSLFNHKGFGWWIFLGNLVLFWGLFYLIFLEAPFYTSTKT